MFGYKLVKKAEYDLLVQASKKIDRLLACGVKERNALITLIEVNRILYNDLQSIKLSIKKPPKKKPVSKKKMVSKRPPVKPITSEANKVTPVASENSSLQDLFNANNPDGVKPRKSKSKGKK